MSWPASRSPVFLLALVCVAAACGSIRYTFSRSTKSAIAARPPTCDFQVLATRPGRPFEEIGILDHMGGACHSTVAAFREHSQAEVCAAGGDAVITEVSGIGCYIRGVVIRYPPGP